ncbi:MAG: class I tRNA ligase family protein, partial [Candidatus Uhrbacteria bacterium]
SRFSQVVEEVTTKLDKYEFSQAGELLRDFTWNEFADWYLEIAKIQRKDKTLIQDTDKILLYILENLLVLWHPFMPFVTEEIWKMFGSDEFIMMHQWPRARNDYDREAEKQFVLLQDIVSAIRNLRAEYRVEPGQKIPVYLVSKKDQEFLESQVEIIRTLARVSPIKIESDLAKPDGAVSSVAGSVQIYLPLADIIDVDKEKVRLHKELEGAEQYLASLEKRLANNDFIAKAPEKMVNDLKQKKSETEEKVNRIKKQLANL